MAKAKLNLLWREQTGTALSVVKSFRGISKHVGIVRVRTAYEHRLVEIGSNRKSHGFALFGQHGPVLFVLLPSRLKISVEEKFTIWARASAWQKLSARSHFIGAGTQAARNFDARIAAKVAREERGKRGCRRSKY